jgi:cobalamin biosynthesis Mg chelatase CobN
VIGSAWKLVEPSLLSALLCSYGRGGERGAARPEVLQALLATTDRVVQEVDSVEYGLTDIQVSNSGM